MPALLASPQLKHAVTGEIRLAHVPEDGDLIAASITTITSTFNTDFRCRTADTTISATTTTATTAAVSAATGSAKSAYAATGTRAS